MAQSAHKNVWLLLVAVLVPLAYLFFYTPYGMDTTDFGYFYGYAWRILEGQIPYRDFYYIKPALPLYWHAFWLWLTPEQYSILGGKAGFVCSLLAAAWLGSLYLNRIFALEKLGLPLPLLATCGFVWAVHSFPHMPWHTADGVLFSAAALWTAAGSTPWSALAAGLFAAAAMLCKQSFLLLPPAILVLIWMLRRRKSHVFLCVAGWLAALGAVYAFLYWAEALEPFKRMTTGQLDVAEALDAGIFIYLRQVWWLPALAILPWCVARLCRKELPLVLQPGYMYLFLLTCWYVYEVLRTQGWIGFGISWPTFFMVLGGVAVLLPAVFLTPWLRDGTSPHPRWRATVALGAALLASWSVAISGGYKIPAMFAVPLLFALIAVHQRFFPHPPRAVRSPLCWTALVCGLFMFGIGYQYPYVFPVRPLTRTELHLDAGQVYSRATGVLVDADMYARLEELKALRAKYGPAYKTMPGFSHAYFLNGDYPLYGSDWLIDWEINAEWQVLYQQLLDKKITVFMERDQLETVQADGYARARYTVPQMVRHHWRVVEETPHFVVFQAPVGEVALPEPKGAATAKP